MVRLIRHKTGAVLDELINDCYNKDLDYIRVTLVKEEKIMNQDNK